MFKEKKLYKSTDRKLDGVCAGIAEYFEIDPTIIRVAYALISLFFAGIGGIVVYIILAIVMPRRPFPDYQYNEFEQNKTNNNQ
jgi:phage shock protein C